MTPEEITIEHVTNQVKMAIEEVVKVEGKIMSYTSVGNSVYIRFANGNSYKQSLISKYTDGVIADDTNTTN